MRRLVVIASLVCSFLVIAFTGGGAASTNRAHAAATAPLSVVRAKDGEVLAFARVVIHGRSFPFLIDTGSSKTLVDVALARTLRLRKVGRPIKITGVGCSETARKVRLSGWSIGGQPLPKIVATSSMIAGTGGRAFGLLGSDVLSRFGAVGIDYSHGVLNLG